MAILFPFILLYKTGELDKNGQPKQAGFRLMVNPTQINVKKAAQIAETRTLGGTVFQPWPNVPDEVTLKGVLYGTRSIVDFRLFQKCIDQRPDLKEITLIYKWKKYTGFVRSLNISANADKPRMFDYELDFVSKTPFSLPRMMLGQLTGYKAEWDFLKSQLYDIKAQFKDTKKGNDWTGAASVVMVGVDIAGAGVFTPATYQDIQSVLNNPDA